VLLFAPPALGAGTWTATGSLNTPRVDHTATLLRNGKVLVAGGGDLGGGLPDPTLASAELYDPVTGSWSATGSMVHARHDHTATLLSDGRVLVAGGANPSGLQQSSELYDPATGRWTATGNLNTARESHAATLLPDGKVLVAGGAGPGSLLASAELYDPATGHWSPTGSMHTAREEHTVTVLARRNVLVAGGCCGPTGALASAELYNAATGTWSTTGSLNSARRGHTATVLESGNVLVAGGSDGGDVMASAELFDLATGSWSATGSLNTAREFHTATLLPNHGGEVLVAGGDTLSGVTFVALASAEVYQPTTGAWATQGSMNTARTSHTATFLATGKVLVAGGVAGPPFIALAGAELFSAPTALELAPSLVANSTGVGPGKALANKATAIQAAVNAGQTAHACARIKDYLALVKAHTGKKLTTDQANDLTTQTTDLATELRC